MPTSRRSGWEEGRRNPAAAAEIDWFEKAAGQGPGEESVTVALRSARVGWGFSALAPRAAPWKMAGAHPDRGWRGLGTARTHRLRRAEDAGNRPAEGAAAKSRSASPWADFGEVGVATRTDPRLTVQSSIANAARAAPLHRVAGAVIVSRRIPSSGTIPLFTA